MKEAQYIRLRGLLESPLLSANNCERTIRIFYDATKLIYQRQKRLKKPQLKPKEISSALLLSDSIQNDMFRFEAAGPLAECFGAFDEAAAIDYYEKNVMGKVTDKRGRIITIDEDGLRSLYKEQGTGRHIIATQNYEEGRGKRLPWIRHTLTNATCVYVNEERFSGSFRRSFLYVATVSIPLTGRKPQTSYYVAVCRESKAGFLDFITAYYVPKRNRFLALIEPCVPII